jgi:hypothetical protein
METIELHLDPQTLVRARQLAASRHCTIEELLKECLEHLGAAAAAGDPFLGMCADEPALIDQVVVSAMQACEEHSLRAPGG